MYILGDARFWPLPLSLLLGDFENRESPLFSMHFFSIFAIVGFSKVLQVMRYSLFFKLLIFSTRSFLVILLILGLWEVGQNLAYVFNFKASQSIFQNIFQYNFSCVLIQNFLSSKLIETILFLASLN